MEKFIVAGLMAIGCLTMTAAPSMAQSVIISERGVHVDRYERHHDRRYYRHHDRRYWGHERVRHFRGERCRTTKMKYRHHGRWVIEKRTVCR